MKRKKKAAFDIAPSRLESETVSQSPKKSKKKGDVRSSHNTSTQEAFGMDNYKGHSPHKGSTKALTLMVQNAGLSEGYGALAQRGEMTNQEKQQ